MSQEKIAVRVYLHTIVRDHTDRYTGEVDCTGMAEEAAMVFELYGPAPEYEIPEWVFEYAFEVAEEHHCEKCYKYKADVHRRAEHGRKVCSDCDQSILSAIRPSRYVPRYPHLDRSKGGAQCT